MQKHPAPSSPHRPKDNIDWKLGTFSLPDSLLHFNTPGLVGWDVVWGSSLAEQGS